MEITIEQLREPGSPMIMLKIAPRSLIQKIRKRVSRDLPVFEHRQLWRSGALYVIGSNHSKAIRDEYGAVVKAFLKPPIVHCHVLTINILKMEF